MLFRRECPPAHTCHKYLILIGNSTRNDREGMTRKLYVKS